MVNNLSTLFLCSVLLVAPSASLAGPVLGPSPTVASDVTSSSNAGGAAGQHPVVIPWGDGVALGDGKAPVSGFIYCAGCSPINPGQLILPTNIPLSKALSASGVIPPSIASAKAAHEGRTSDIEGLNNLPAEEPGKRAWDDGGIPVQDMAMHGDGRYSFSFNTNHASRQEERNLDGSVSGSYSYTDPDGKLVQIDYTAGPKTGYQAFGENVPLQQALPLPQPVQDTLEVQLARQEFLNAYNKELERIERDQAAAAEAAAAANATSPAPDSESSGSENTEASTETAAGDETEHIDVRAEVGKTEQDEVHGKSDVGQDEDAVVINAKSGDEQAAAPVDPASLPSPAYQITIPIGVGGNAGVNVQQTPLINNQMGVPEQGNNVIDQGNMAPQASPAGKSKLQPYFYYISVGGQPHYVTSNGNTGYSSPYPTSLKATLLGAQPLDAVHDTQVPTRASGAGQQTPAATRPIYLDLQNGLSQQQPQQSYQMISQQPQQNLLQLNSASLMNNQQTLQATNPLLGQLFPLGLSQGSTATFGYIPALIVNSSGASSGVAQSSEGSQPNNVPQQQQVSPVPSLNNQPVIFYAAKK